MTANVNDVIYIPPTPVNYTINNAYSDYRVVFIPGNPGLVSYYAHFLRQLSSNLNGTYGAQNRIYHVFGFSLSGFEVNSQPPRGRRNGLKEQVDFLVSKIADAMCDVPESVFTASGTDARTQISQPNNIPHLQGDGVITKSKPRLILMGHSLGTWLALALLSRFRSGLSYEVSATVLLYPTVFDIAKSARGKRWGWLLTQAWVPSVASSLLSMVSWILGERLWRSILLHLVQTVLNARSTTQLCDEGVDTTVAWILSKGPEQTLFLAREELLYFKDDDVWGEDIWGAERVSGQRNGEDFTAVNNRTMFYFGQQDHWLANKTRDDLITKRGRPFVSVSEFYERTIPEEWKPQMKIDESAPPHSFCVRKDDSNYVAAQASKFIQLNVEDDP